MAGTVNVAVKFCIDDKRLVSELARPDVLFGRADEAVRYSVELGKEPKRKAFITCPNLIPKSLSDILRKRDSLFDELEEGEKAGH